AVGSVREATHAVGVKGKGLEGVKGNVARRIKGDVLFAEQPYAARVADLLQYGVYAVDLNRLRIVPGQTQHDGRVRAMALARGAQRAIEFHHHALEVRQVRRRQCRFG